MKQSINSCEYFLTGTDSKHELYSRFHNLVGPWYIHFLVRHTLLLLLLLLAGWLVVFFLFQSKGKINSSLFFSHKKSQKNNPNENNMNSIDKKLIETEFSFVKITLTGN